jgi:hypothetical protein
MQSYGTLTVNPNTDLQLILKMLSCLKQIVLLMLQCTYYNAIWWDDMHYRTEAIDQNRYTTDTGVIGTYEGEDGHEQEYCAIIQNIIKLDYRRFDVFFFNVRWLKDVLDKVPQSSIIIDGNGFTMIDSTRICSASKGTFILPAHCE